MSVETVSIRLARFDFLGARWRDAAGHPLVSAEFAAEQGPRVLLVDVRERPELDGPLGVVPNAVHLPLSRITELLRLGPNTRVALISREGQRAATAARLLELAGLGVVAAVDGGLLAWRAAGLMTSRDPGCLREALPDDPDAPLRPSGRPPGPLTLDELRAHAGDRPRVRWIRLAAFLHNGRTACVDGRDSQGVVGTPGGDLGEIALALAAAEACGAPIGPAEVRALLRSWIDAFGRIYYHSDIHALNRFIVELRADPAVPESLLPTREAPPTEWRRFLAGPPEPVRARVLASLSGPGSVGCGHLRLSLEDGPSYGVRGDLVAEVIRAFHEARWEGLPELEFVVLGGGHEEGAVLLVRVEGRLMPHTRIPLIPPAVGGVQMFVHHPQVSAVQRDGVAHWLVGRPELPGLRGREPEVRAALEALAERQMAHTLGKLADGLPIFEATFREDRTAIVRELGRVAR